METKVDLEDLPKLQEFNISWFAKWSATAKKYYVCACEYLGLVDGKPKYKTHYLHRFLTNPTETQYVDHKNHDTLNNKRNNLRLSDNDENTKNREKKNSNNTSGYRNVSWIKSEKKYVVQLQIDGKNTRLGFFDDVDEAGRFAEKMRKKYYGKYKGAS